MDFYLKTIAFEVPPGKREARLEYTFEGQTRTLELHKGSFLDCNDVLFLGSFKEICDELTRKLELESTKLALKHAAADQTRACYKVISRQA